MLHSPRLAPLWAGDVASVASSESDRDIAAARALVVGSICKAALHALVCYAFVAVRKWAIYLESCNAYRIWFSQSRTLPRSTSKGGIRQVRYLVQ
jgi:hypothetical protein